MFWTVNYSFIIVILLTTCRASQRTLQFFLNPGCDEICKVENVTTVYLRADGAHDTLHYVWDFVGNPSLLLAVTSPTAQLRVNWDDYLVNLPQSIKFTETPKYTFGIVIQKIYEFNDVNDTGLLDTVRKADINILNTKMFKWLRRNIVNDSKFVELQMDSDVYSDPESNITRLGNLQIMISKLGFHESNLISTKTYFAFLEHNKSVGENMEGDLLPTEHELNGFNTLDHSDVMPHMLHSENSTQIDIVFNKLETNSTFKSSRFGMELLLVSEQSPYEPMSVDAMKSLDDEHTPGIFEVVELKTPHVKIKDGAANAAYLQWRPVSYTESFRSVTDTTESVYYPLVNVTGQSNVAMDSLLYAYYGQRMNGLLAEKLNITLGTKGDGFYKKSNYTTWTFIVGYGIPPAERFSYLVIMIISIGVGLPAMIMLVVGIYMCARRIPQRNRNLLVNS